MKVLGLDMGSKLIGVAISDQLGLIAFPHSCINHKNEESDAEEIYSLAKNSQVETIVIGIPYSLDGSLGPQAQTVTKFYEFLKNYGSIVVISWDERFSTADAMNRLRETGETNIKDKSKINAAAAAIILQSYLDSQN